MNGYLFSRSYQTTVKCRATPVLDTSYSEKGAVGMLDFFASLNSGSRGCGNPMFQKPSPEQFGATQISANGALRVASLMEHYGKFGQVRPEWSTL